MVSGRGPRARGFTLIELLIALTIGSVLVAAGMPAFGELIAKQRLRGAATDLFSAVLRTRSEAIKRNAEVTLRPVNSARWDEGWRIADPANSGNLLESHDAIILSNISGPSSLVYLANGRLKGTASVRFNVSSDDTDERRCIRVDLSGRPYTTNAAC